MSERMNEAINRLAEIQEQNLLGGGQKHVDRQHARNKMTARERIDALLDPGTFLETGSCVNTTSVRMDGRTTDAPCDGAITGTGKVDGRLIGVYSSDFTVLGGSLGAQHLQKCSEWIIQCTKLGIPMVWLLDSSGGRLGYQDVMFAGIEWYFCTISRSSGVVPQINVLMGPCIAGQAYAPTLCDFLLMSRETANLWLAGPRQAKAVTSEEIDKSVGSADYHVAHSGTCDVVGDNDAETIAKTRELLSYLPSNFREKPPVKEAPADSFCDVEKLMELVPDDLSKTYDMHEVIKVLVDDGDFFEVKDQYAKNLICCFARIDGKPVGIVANNPAEPGSIMEINSCDKYYRFLQVLDAFNIPLVTLVDTPPYVPGEEQEEKGLLRHFGKIVDVYTTSTIPKISIVLREAYADAGAMIMGVSKGMGADAALAWPIAQYAVEASELDYREVVKGMEDDAYEGYLNWGREKIDVFDVARGFTTQVVDEIIHPKETRKRIIQSLELFKNKEEELPLRAKCHGTMPS
ncbi:Acetyl-CoA carboxylase, carboxyltransferase component [Desulfatibacillum alkenivorans DSM 16219]|uniref:Acetyl-CoA carboxylase, carboxyltransferase component n=1 Tax=Desulfatibacillum alkenivorans DSM 16219 TaxID=1121393 RepID=A0A1M6TF44_9BACT|nr:carboxyl transferase domain-containing protein [Desulfatibacillum alkenivorans]SHK55652.1 Acetyl-CoA carboxylase, carboxyltransferase component [Desulfatibacillum alkenivorans DSM 16219]